MQVKYTKVLGTVLEKSSFDMTAQVTVVPYHVLGNVTQHRRLGQRTQYDKVASALDDTERFVGQS